MKKKIDVIFPSSNEDLLRIFVFILTIGISIMASIFDYKSCYMTIIVQACSNMYEFYYFTNNKKYENKILKPSIAIILFSIVAIMFSILALLETVDFTKTYACKFINIAFVTLPIIVLYNDYKRNVIKENRLEE